MFNTPLKCGEFCLRLSTFILFPYTYSSQHKGKCKVTTNGRYLCYNPLMNIVEFVKSELSGWGKIERWVFPFEILLIIAICLSIGDSKVAIVSAVCGISYTILAGKGKISCFLFGLAGTLCYAYIAFRNQIYGNVALYALYYFPMQVLGIFRWKKHLKTNSTEIVKTSLSNKERWFYGAVAVVLSFALFLVLRATGDASPLMDSLTTVLSVGGLLLTVKRCIEQWYFWLVVNGLSTVMWVEAYLNGSNCLATVFMWVTYFALAFYFLRTWQKEIDEFKNVK